MKVIITENKLERILIRYLQEVEKIDFEPTKNGRYLEYRDYNGDLVMEIDTWFPNSTDCKLKYDLYIKMYRFLNLEASQYHDLLTSVINKITGIEVETLVPSIGYTN
jgi:hypothetical protein